MNSKKPEVKIDQELESLIREARELRGRYVAGLLRGASSAVFSFLQSGRRILKQRISGKTTGASFDLR